MAHPNIQRMPYCTPLSTFLDPPLPSFLYSKTHYPPSTLRHTILPTCNNMSSIGSFGSSLYLGHHLRNRSTPSALRLLYIAISLLMLSIFCDTLIHLLSLQVHIYSMCQKSGQRYGKGTVKVTVRPFWYCSSTV